jgi:hypothetical protein
MPEKREKSRSRSSGPEKGQKAVNSATSSKTSNYLKKPAVNVRIRSKSDGTSKHRDAKTKDRKLSKASKTSIDKISFVENENYESIKTKILNQLTPKNGKGPIVNKIKKSTNDAELRPKSKDRRTKPKYQKHELEDLSNQGLAILNVNTFQSKTTLSSMAFNFYFKMMFSLKKRSCEC